jgi:hypothetical protein
MLVDIPGQILGLPFLIIPGILLALVSKETSSYLAALNWILFGSIQWWFIGGYIRSRLRKPPNPPLQPTAEERGG